MSWLKPRRLLRNAKTVTSCAENVSRTSFFVYRSFLPLIFFLIGIQNFRNIEKVMQRIRIFTIKHEPSELNQQNCHMEDLETCLAKLLLLKSNNKRMMISRFLPRYQQRHFKNYSCLVITLKAVDSNLAPFSNLASLKSTYLTKAISKDRKKRSFLIQSESIK